MFKKSLEKSLNIITGETEYFLSSLYFSVVSEFPIMGMLIIDTEPILSRDRKPKMEQYQWFLYETGKEEYKYQTLLFWGRIIKEQRTEYIS